ncbi:MAG: zinc ribbon domain-containing protein YjdM [Kofleriaceae bacterium]
MSELDAAPPCPVCAMENVYPDGDQWVCADCGHEWGGGAAPAEEEPSTPSDDGVVRDVNGVPLVNGDAVVLIKSLKLKGSSITLKQGTKITGIRLASGDHEVDCRVDNLNVMLKAQYLRKA